MFLFSAATRRSGAALFAAALFACPLVADAQEPATVTIGGMTKKTVGTITGMNPGDVACYVTLRDDRGATFEELADFEICEKEAALKGRRVALTWEIGKVMADSCQGDPACKQTRTVALIRAARVIGPASGAVAPAVKPAVAGRQSSFCTPLETVVFACRTGEKMVSVCASGATSPGKGSLQYRFGKPDSTDPLDIALPSGDVAPSKAATGAGVPFSGGGGAWLRFASGAHAYTVYSGIGKWGPNGETREKNGLVVERDGKRIASLKCAGDAAGELGPVWFDRVGVTSGGRDFDFPD